MNQCVLLYVVLCCVCFFYLVCVTLGSVYRGLGCAALLCHDTLCVVFVLVWFVLLCVALRCVICVVLRWFVVFPYDVVLYMC